MTRRRRWLARGLVFAAVLTVAVAALYRTLISPFETYEEYHRIRNERVGDFVIRLQDEGVKAESVQDPLESEQFLSKQRILSRELRELDSALLTGRMIMARNHAASLLEKFLTDDDYLVAMLLTEDSTESAVWKGLLAVVLFADEAADAAAFLKERLVAAALYSEHEKVWTRAVKFLGIDSGTVNEEPRRPAFRWGDLRDTALAQAVLDTIHSDFDSKRSRRLLRLLRNVDPKDRDEFQQDLIIPRMEEWAEKQDQLPLRERMGGPSFVGMILSSDYDIELIYGSLKHPLARMALWRRLPDKEPYLTEWREAAATLGESGRLNELDHEIASSALFRLARSGDMETTLTILRLYHPSLHGSEPMPAADAPDEERYAYAIRWNPMFSAAGLARNLEGTDDPQLISYFVDLMACPHAVCQERAQGWQSPLDRVQGE